MDEMNAFDRQLARALAQRAGPVRPVDDAAIFSAIAVAEPRRWRFESMFSATKLVVAGALVALFGGFLVAGFLSQPSEESLPVVGASALASPQGVDATTDALDTTIRTDILAGVSLEVEELQPGVYRVVNDGHRDLRWVPGEAYWVTPSAITVAPDGSVWSFTLPKYTGEGCRVEPGEVGCMVFYRLGSTETHEMLDEWILDDSGVVAGRTDPVAVAPDGTIWAIVRRADHSGQELRSFDGEAWTIRRGTVEHVAVATDGTVWALWTNANDRVRLGRLTDEGWSTVRLARSERLVTTGDRLVTGADGDVYLFFEDDGSLHRIDDLDHLPTVVQSNQRWGEHAPHEGGGVFWWRDPVGDDQPAVLVRNDGTDETRFAGPPASELGHVVAVGLDGAAWLAGQVDGGGCDGIHRYDGSEAPHFLAGTCPTSIDIAPDGSVWLHAVPAPTSPDTEHVDTYVITPQAWMEGEDR